MYNFSLCYIIKLINHKMKISEEKNQSSHSDGGCKTTSKFVSYYLCHVLLVIRTSPLFVQRFLFMWLTLISSDRLNASRSIKMEMDESALSNNGQSIGLGGPHRRTTCVALSRKSQLAGWSPHFTTNISRPFFFF